MNEARNHFPGIKGDWCWQAIYEKDAGYLLVEQCVANYLQQAERFGATLRYSERVKHWEARSNAVVVQLEKETLQANKLVLCAGPWAQQALASYRLPLTILRKHLYWYRCESDAYLETLRFPCFFYDAPDGFYYGFPAQGEFGLKVARHNGGAPVHVVDGTHVREMEDQTLVENFLRSYLPGVLGSQSSSTALSRWSGCYYTMTPDEHFIVDRLPDSRNVVVIAGLSGHGFKFTSVLGEIACRLALGEDVGLDIRFLGIDRFLNQPSNT
jgi:glycine/D-amino acid oxidase-like deaminating enzyme